MFTTPDLYDAHPDDVVACILQFRDLGRVGRFAGPIRTLHVDDDNLAVRDTLASPGEGAVLVVDNGGSMRVAMVGDNLAASAEANGWAGVIVNGVVRDSTDLARTGIGIRALGTNPTRAAKSGPIAVDVPVTFGDATFTPGHWVYADADGVVVAPRKLH